jgi:type I restriction enzyme S subunit
MSENTPFASAWREDTVRSIVDPSRPITYGVVQPGTRLDQGVPIIRGQDYSGGSVDDSDLYLIHPTIAASYKRSAVKGGDILFSIVGYLGQTAIVPEHLSGANITQTTARIAVKHPYLSRFFLQQFRSENFSAEVRRYQKGSAQPGLNLADVEKMKVVIPLPEDQSRIAAILDTADDAIRQTEAMVEKLKKIKQGLLHDLLTRGIGKDGKLRPTPERAPHLYKDSPLGKIPKEWEVLKISSCSETFAGGTPSRGRLDYYGGSIPWVKSAEVNLDEILSTEEFLTEKGLRCSSARWIEPDITLIAMYGATAGQVSWLKIRATANQAVLALPPRDSQTSSRWLYWAAKGAMPRIMASVQGSGQPNLSKGVIDKSLISRPLPGEQKAIRDCLDQISERIRIEGCVASKFGLIKQGLIEDLLTGRVTATGLPKDIEKMLDEIAGGN